MGPWTKDLTGKRFSRLLVVRYRGVTPRSHSLWECLCDCGKTKLIQGSNMIRGHVMSCGCLLAETHASRKGTTNGMRHNDVWRIWRGMIKRCTNPKAKNYPSYGGRGIKVCDSWLNSFDHFISDIGPRPSPSHSIDRKEVNGDYEPNNCRWATATEQANNRRCTHWIEFRGQKRTITEWSRDLGLTPTALRLRIEYGWDFERAMTQPGNRKKKAAPDGAA